MAVQTSTARTSAPELQLYMEHPSEALIRQYAFEVFGDSAKTEDWLRNEIASLGNITPETLLTSGDPESLRRVLGVLIQIDYGVVS
jgi:uncharacterized protein (DUF2384 family)